MPCHFLVCYDRGDGADDDGEDDDCGDIDNDEEEGADDSAVVDLDARGRRAVAESMPWKMVFQALMHPRTELKAKIHMHRTIDITKWATRITEANTPVESPCQSPDVLDFLFTDGMDTFFVALIGRVEIFRRLPYELVPAHMHEDGKNHV
ncbi:hypothetical protein DFQ30_005356 [Apophysomyces sp. BC1015]|nr:hypothetical protein DFQ30_005356 [Apophysomyces sp. BC1015]